MIGSPIVAPPLPVGFGDLAVALNLISNAKEYRKRLDEMVAAQRAAEEAVARVGAVKDIERLHAEAKEKAAEADEIVSNARNRAAQIVADGQRNADRIEAQATADRQAAADEKAQSQSDARARNAKCLERERALEEREAAAEQRQADLEARSESLGEREAALDERERVVTQREARLSGLAKEIA